MRTSVWLLAVALMAAGCSHNPYMDASLTRYQGKDRAWIEKELGAPDAKTSRFFGGEKWTYNRIAGGTAGPPLFNFKANECQMILFFDKNDTVSDTNYSGC
ncbi:MAG: hypothetical protein WBB60_18550 [Nitrospira sp.]|nr:hypothetical protein [Nitrospira sp.]MBP6605092.1 hypothetical protein [Nitrospira sp.]HQY56281.1 hypothetical protein [Nitrospira sp.]HRA96003.1 hypothetical protein [Nitrospira sp.]